MKNKIFVTVVIFALLGCQETVSNSPDSESELSVPEQCTLSPDPGPCEAYIIKYYYDQGEKACKEFVWGGCGGVVPFNSLEECKECERSKY